MYNENKKIILVFLLISIIQVLLGIHIQDKKLVVVSIFFNSY